MPTTLCAPFALQYDRTILTFISYGPVTTAWYNPYISKILLLWHTDVKQSECDDTDKIEMKNNNIYGQLPQQQVVKNPAYNWWKPTSL